MPLNVVFAEREGIMKITSLRLRVLQNSVTKLKGFASIVLDDFIVINDIKVLYNNGTYFLAMPSKQIKAGVFKDMAHPIHAAGRKYIEDAVFYAYHRAVEMNGERVQMQLHHPESIDTVEFTAEHYDVDFLADRIYTAEESQIQKKTEESEFVIPDDDWHKWFNY